MKLLQFTINTIQSLSKYDDCLIPEELEPQIEFARIWDNSYLKLKELYKLPELRLTGEGFEQGKATATDCIDTARIIRKTAKKNIYFYHCSEFTLFSFLDQELIRLMEPEVNKLIYRYDNYCKGYIKTTVKPKSKINESIKI